MSAIHREHPDATPEEIRSLEGAALLGPREREPGDVESRCRTCGDPVVLSARVAARPASKWTRSCPSCLAFEL